MPRDTIVNEITIEAPDMMLNLEQLIKNHVEAIDKLKLEIKQTREMFEDSFSSNPTYREHSERVKEVTKGKTSVRAEILKQPAVANLQQKLKDLKFDMNEKQKTLSDLLIDYKEQTGAQQLELFDGRLMEMQTTVKLVRSR